MNRKPRVVTGCVANHYAASNERIIEYSFPDTGDGAGPLGGLISFRLLNDGTPIVNLYRHDAGIQIYVSKPDHD